MFADTVSCQYLLPGLKPAWVHLPEGLLQQEHKHMTLNLRAVILEPFWLWLPHLKTKQQ